MQMWTRSYFVSTAGDVSNATIQRYVEEQKRKEGNHGIREQNSTPSFVLTLPMVIGLNEQDLLYKEFKKCGIIYNQLVSVTTKCGISCVRRANIVS